MLLSCAAPQEAIISHGCTVKSSTINHAVVGLRSHIEEGCTIEVSHLQTHHEWQQAWEA